MNEHIKTETLMYKRRFHMRSPERLACLEVNRVVDLVNQRGDIRYIMNMGTGSGIFAEVFAHAGL